MIVTPGREPPALYATSLAWGNYPELVGLTLRSHGRCVQELSLQKTLFHKGFSKSRRCPSSDYIPGDNGNKFLYHLVAHRSTTAVTTLSSAKRGRFPVDTGSHDIGSVFSG